MGIQDGRTYTRRHKNYSSESEILSDSRHGELWKTPSSGDRSMWWTPSFRENESQKQYGIESEVRLPQVPERPPLVAKVSYSQLSPSLWPPPSSRIDTILWNGIYNRAKMAGSTVVTGVTLWCNEVAKIKTSWPLVVGHVWSSLQKENTLKWGGGVTEWNNCEQPVHWGLW